MLGRQHEVRRAEDRVRARREDFDLRAIEHPEAQPRALRATDPVPLRLLRRRRPIERVEVVQQPLGVVRDAEEPLFEEALFNQRAAPFTAAIDHLLVREHGLVGRAPVHRAGLLVREAALEQLQEDPLRPLVVGRVGRVHRVRPVHHQSRAVELAPEVRDIARDQFRRMHADLQREVLRVDAERVISQRLEYTLPLQALEPRVDITSGEREEVPDVQPLGGRIREHHQRVVRLLRVREVGLMRAPLGPTLPPPCFDRRWVVAERLVGGTRGSGRNGCCHFLWKGI